MNSTKEKIAKILIENKNNFISGEFISSELGISRASIWKHINSLKNEGFNIQSKNKLGYKLSLDKKKSISAYEISYNLNTSIVGNTVVYFESIDSTNTYAKKIARNSKEGTIVVAEEQTEGRGRSGKSWVSKKGDGVYFSIILKPEIPITRASFLTQVAGAAMILALSKLGIDVGIKWPNDIILNGKKICGILTEMEAEIERISHIIIGIGTNLYSKEFDKDISHKATSLQNEGYEVNKVDFIHAFCEEFENLYIKFLSNDTSSIIDILKEKSVLIGREIYIIDRNDKRKVVAHDIDNLGNLIVKNEHGNLETIFSGEISIRGLDSYI